MTRSNFVDSAHMTYIKHLDSAIASHHLTHDTTLYRGAKLSKALHIGGTLTDHGYLSTSLSQKQAEDFTKGGDKPYRYLLRIQVPSGTKGLVAQDAFTPDLLKTKYKWVPHEQEVILGRSSSFVIKDITDAGNYKIVDMGVE